MAKKPREPRVEEGQVRVHDPFELVRWLALSQEPLEQLVEVAAYADRKISERPPGGRPRRSKPVE